MKGLDGQPVDGGQLRRSILITLLVLFGLLAPFLFGYHFDAIRSKASDFYASTSLATEAQPPSEHSTATTTTLATTITPTPNLPANDGPLIGDNVSDVHTTTDPSVKQVHLILPATGATRNFCKLLLTATITGFPEPIVVGWEGRGIYNGTASHLFKITETSTYLRSLPPSADADLVIVLDAYDIWLQLPMSVMITRYHDILKKNDARLAREGLLGKTGWGAKIESKIVLGPDHMAWPEPAHEPSHWAVPESPLPADAFGPNTDKGIDVTRPRWVNSGTMMGPVAQMRAFFETAVDTVSREFTDTKEYRHSDQYYFSKVWGHQELNRLKQREGDNFLAVVPDYARDKLPNIPASRRTEFGLALDAEPQIFQNAAGFTNHLSWMTFNGSVAPPITGELAPGTSFENWTLPADLLSTPPPFSAATAAEIPTQPGWADIQLGTNAIRQNPFALLHMTGDKSLRERWWGKLWFHPHGEALQKALTRKQHAGAEEGLLRLEGVRYTQGRPVNADPEAVVRAAGEEKAGVWMADTGGYVAWDSISACVKEPEDLYQTAEVEKEGRAVVGG